MSRTSKIMTGLSLALALSFSVAPLALAQMNGTDWENGGIAPAAFAVQVPASFHMGPANGSTYENGSVGLPQGAKGAANLPTQSLGDKGEHYGPLNGSAYENMR